MKIYLHFPNYLAQQCSQSLQTVGSDDTSRLIPAHNMEMWERDSKSLVSLPQPPEWFFCHFLFYALQSWFYSFYNLNLTISVCSLKYYCFGVNILNLSSIQRQTCLLVSYPASCTCSFMSLILRPFCSLCPEKSSPSCLALLHPSTLDSSVILSGKPSSPHPDRDSCPCSRCTEAPSGV